VVDEPVQAAGAICWRAGPDGDLEVLLAFSRRYGTWGWPKGKLEVGETLPECAVREVVEETGVQPLLGLPLPTVRYRLPDGRHKQVRYWAARVASSGPRSAEGEREISEVAWLPARSAMNRLAQHGDLAPVRKLLQLADSRMLDTRALVLVRHAKARGRSSWQGDEADRPLTRRGLAESERLAGLLGCWEPARVLSSPWDRCMQTVRPYAQAHDVKVERVPALTELALKDDPKRAGKTFIRMLADAEDQVICTHRPVLQQLIAVLGQYCSMQMRAQLPTEDPWLSPAEALVLQVVQLDSLFGARPQVRAVERYHAL
jgi:8-oxo-dGTP diphosphatase